MEHYVRFVVDKFVAMCYLKFALIFKLRDTLFKDFNYAANDLRLLCAHLDCR